MATNLTYLLIILFISSITYQYLSIAIKPAVNAKDFKIWIISCAAITSISFLSFNALMLFFLCGLVISIAARKVENKIALYFPAAYLVQGYQLQTPLLNITYQSILGLCLLLPLFVTLLVEKKELRTAKSNADIFLILYLLIVFLLKFRGLETKSAYGYLLTYPQLVKIGLTSFLEIFLPYYVISRYIKNFNQIKTIVLALICLCLLISALAFYETATTTSLYSLIPRILGLDYLPAFNVRSGLLRANVSIDHPLSLGLLLLVGLSLFTFASHYIKNKLTITIGVALLLIGLIVTISKGPWTGAALSFVIIYMLSPNKLRNGFIAILIMTVIVLLLMSIGSFDKLISFLPFVGDIDSGTSDYRKLFLKQSLVMIKEFPIFGLYEPRDHKAMLPLFQGEGIVDFINVYASIALQNGLSALFMYSLFLLTVLFSLTKEVLLLKDSKSDRFKLGAGLIGGMFGILLVLSVISNTTQVNTILISFCGLTVGFTNVLKNERRKSISDIATYSTSRKINQ